MPELKEVQLPSGALLKIQLCPFAESKALLTAVLEETKTLRIDTDTEIDINLLKDLVCSGISSPKIERALTTCMSRALYNDLKIDKDTFESEDTRQDYLVVCFEVAKANIMPFMKSLAQRLPQALAGTINKSLGQK